MKDISLGYNPVRIRNSSIEFVVVGLEGGEYRPIIVSDNCGLDLLGFSASQSYSKKLSTTEKKSSSLFSVLRSSSSNYVSQSLELTVSAYLFDYEGEEQSDKVILFWKGARLNKTEEIRRVAEINFSIIMKEMYKQGKNDKQLSDRRFAKEQQRGYFDGFLEWHISPVIKAIVDENARYDRSREGLRVLFGAYGVAVVIAFMVAIASYVGSILTKVGMN